MKRRLIWAMLICMLAGLIPAMSAQAADMLVTNYSFESNLTGWTQAYGTGSISASTDQAFTGTKSLKIADTSSTTQYGMESTKLSATAGEEYMVYARTYIASGQADLYLRFWNSSNQVVGSFVGHKSTPANEWTFMKTKAVAPAGTAYVTALLYSSASNTGTVYWDDVYITHDITLIGSQVYNATIHAAAIDATYSYILADGIYGSAATQPAQLIVVNNVTGAKVRSIDLPGAAGGWTATIATDGKVYLGTYSGGKLFQYTPGATTVTDLGQVLPGVTQVYGLYPGPSGKIYGGTYPTAEMWKYEPGSGISEISASNPLVPGSQYIRSLAYDTANNVSYVGGGTPAKLIRFKNSTGARQDILPSAYADEFVYDLDFEGGKVFARLLDSANMLVLNVTEDASGNVTTVVDKVLPGVTSYGTSNLYNGNVYYGNGGLLQAYNIASKTYSALGVDAGFSPNAISIQTLSDQVNFPGATLVAVGKKKEYAYPQMFKYNFQTGATQLTDIVSTPVPTKIRSIVKGPDNKVYTSGYLVGGTGVYSPLRNDLSASYIGSGQSENMVTSNGKIYMGVYPAARLYEYDPSAAWSAGSSPTSNPKLLTSADSDDQDRPFGMTAGGGQIFMGTVPEYGANGGAIVEYTPSTGVTEVHRNIVSNQSVLTLAYLNGDVFGGTGIFGGMDAPVLATVAKLFKFTPSTNAVSVINLPVTGIEAVTSVIVGPDNNIWCMGEGKLMIYDPVALSWIHNSNPFPSITYSSSSAVYKDASLIVGKDGKVYGTIDGTYLFVIDPTTKAVTTLYSGGAENMASDEFGNLYFSKDEDLKRYSF